jgi:FAD/FMN-containing dehydrogenase
VRLTRAQAQPSCPAPPAFPASIPLYQQTYQNWAHEIRVDGLWTCAPRSPGEVVTLVNWAAENGYRVRPRGMMHGWSPLIVTPGTICSEKTLLADTTQHLTGIEVVPGSPAAVRVGAGATMDALLAELEAAGLGLTACPAPGDITVGGALAIDAHGTAIPAAGETQTEGHTYGSLSNLVTALTAVVWDPGAGAYAVRRFERSDPACKALLVNLGRIFVTEVELRVGQDANLRCQSFTDIPVSELLAAPGTGGRTFASFLEQSGRAEVIWFPFTDAPWLKVWSLSPEKPPSARKVSSPYNYPFSDNLPESVSDLASQIIRGASALTPLFGQLQLQVSRAGLLATGSADLWGPSKNLLLYIKPTTIRETANGYAVHCRRSEVQRVLSEFYAYYKTLLASYTARGVYPQNMPIEIRVTGLERPEDVGVAGAEAPMLSALAPHPGHPARDVAVWINVLTFPGTRGSAQFYRELERWILTNYSSYAHVRPEWSKGWAYSGEATWADPEVLGAVIPAAYRDGYSEDANWDWARAEFARHDPHSVFGNAFLDELFPPAPGGTPDPAPPPVLGSGGQAERRRRRRKRKRKRRRRRQRQPPRNR